jgi:two-component system copper resistance phosphate regulon response regulator CusR
VVGREEISEHVWDDTFDPFSNLIEVYIKRLRKKLDENFGLQLIHTRRGVGYILDDV